ncbi:succinate dehydrogenase [Sulfodiicoccus acidiphilus]|uniref:succinate dehydrogenase n=1 Tax=Sulfodiicoccus acidiphilus TaxID=1670455 RepID=A0A348B3P4_9CREN|nr:succinate dehydrogenase/fumarate reductase iron-sulfur subunit [Sulfodiicoccus acidiphilus]BBD72796.1 succinate dehydrogenase [Sulfodiicoccus acidiphilus]GGT99877.1 succinate dehydrogenase [Sulfodiicoccus acidiphilus]
MKELDKEVKVKVKRFSEEKGTWWQEYTVKVDKYTQMTEVLKRIKEEQDPTLSYRASCHMAVCGSCGMRINGAPRLACRTIALEEVDRTGSDTIVVEPMDGYPVLKDLVVDLTDFYNRMYKVKPRLHPSEDVLKGKSEHRLKPEDQSRLWKFAQCIWCGLCVSSCPAVRIDVEFLGPAAHAKGYRFLSDPRDTSFEERAKVLIDSAWRCTYCYMCYEVCPRDIEPVEAIKLTRTYTTKFGPTGDASSFGERHSKAVEESIAETGMLQGGKVYVKTYGLVNSLISMIELMKDGKATKLIMERQKKVRGIDELRKLLGEKQ